MTGLLCLSVWMLFHLRQKCSVINYDFQGGGLVFLNMFKQRSSLTSYKPNFTLFLQKICIAVCLILPFYHCESISPAFVQIEVETGEPTARRPSKKTRKEWFQHIVGTNCSPLWSDFTEAMEKKDASRMPNIYMQIRELAASRITV